MVKRQPDSWINLISFRQLWSTVTMIQTLPRIEEYCLQKKDARSSNVTLTCLMTLLSSYLQELFLVGDLETKLDPSWRCYKVDWDPVSGKIVRSWNLSNSSPTFALTNISVGWGLCSLQANCAVHNVRNNQYVLLCTEWMLSKWGAWIRRTWSMTSTTLWWGRAVFILLDR